MKRTRHTKARLANALCRSTKAARDDRLSQGVRELPTMSQLLEVTGQPSSGPVAELPQFHRGRGPFRILRPSLASTW